MDAPLPSFAAAISASSPTPLSNPSFAPADSRPSSPSGDSTDTDYAPPSAPRRGRPPAAQTKHRRLNDAPPASPVGWALEDSDDDYEEYEYQAGAGSRSGDDTDRHRRASSSGETNETETTKYKKRKVIDGYATRELYKQLLISEYPSTETREALGAKLGMTARAVQVWFQNKRQKRKRLMKEGLPSPVQQVDPSRSTSSPPPVRRHSVATESLPTTPTPQRHNIECAHPTPPYPQPEYPRYSSTSLVTPPGAKYSGTPPAEWVHYVPSELAPYFHEFLRQHHPAWQTIPKDVVCRRASYPTEYPHYDCDHERTVSPPPLSPPTPTYTKSSPSPPASEPKGLDLLATVALAKEMEDEWVARRKKYNQYLNITSVAKSENLERAM
ncbi:hypothetical protein HK104_003813 [Borealophlyctis nickersoniae]|nr:hypothetical protein HK104_003813 [Borealophlyctis nickersoniae]